MCGSGASRHTTINGLSPRVKVAILSSRNHVVVFSLYSMRENISGNPGTLGSGAMAATPVMVLQVQCTGVSAGAGWNVCAGAVGMAGVGAGGNIPLVCGVPVAPDWQACVYTHLSIVVFLPPHWGSPCSLSTCTYKIATEDARALMLSRIWLI